MNGLLLKMGFFDKIGTFFDIIPKVLYFLCTVFASVIDVLQLMVRKLAGLDRYWMPIVDESTGVAGGYTQITQQDPLTEFIYGILGHGQSAAAYKGLNTVFLSLTVFAVVCLAVTSMIAIIKSHYNEDANATNPWKYIYTAIKAALTYAVIPFVTVIGMQLASWVLRTLDSITAGSAGSGEMRYHYGQNYNQVFVGGTLEEGGPTYYSNYDFFGIRLPELTVTTSTPFSGMIFKACTYNANRARNDESYAKAIKEEITDSNGTKIFAGDSYAYEAIDFAFANHLNLQHIIRKSHLIDVLVDGCGVMYWGATDLIVGLTGGSGSFSKFNVGLVWMFYNLWSYDFIVAMVGGVTVVGIMLSVIIGLMSRLLKAAIMFLIYPALLGIAPLDNFKAFKSWASKFIQQIMMAFGAIIGMNLTLLILPYAQTIAWFNPTWFGVDILNNLINTVVMVTGLMMMKDIIAMISEFAGGADANSSGAALKGEVGKGLATGAKFVGKTALGVGRGMVQLGAAGGKLIGKVSSAARGNSEGAKRKRAVTAANNAIATANDDLDTAQQSRGIADTRVATASAALDSELAANWNQSTGMLHAQNAAVKELEGTHAFKAAKNDPEAQKRMREEAKAKARRQYYEQHKDEFGGSVKAAGDAYDAAVADRDASDASVAAAEANVVKAKAHAAKVAKVENLELNEDGTVQLDAKGKPVKHKKTDEERAEENVQKHGLKKGYTSETDSDGNTIYKDKYGREVNVTEAAQTGWGKAGEKINDFASFKEAGKHVADGFLKGIGDIGSAVGLDKLFSGVADIFKGGLKLDGGVFDMKDPKLEGDKLTTAEHEKTRQAQEKASKDSTKEIVSAIESLKKAQAGDSSGIAKAAADMKVATNNLNKIAEQLGKLTGGSK